MKRDSVDFGCFPDFDFPGNDTYVKGIIAAVVDSRVAVGWYPLAKGCRKIRVSGVAARPGIIMDTYMLTLALGGRVEIEQLQKGIARFRQRASALTPGKGVKRAVADLHPGSATISLTAETATPAAAAKAVPVVADFDSSGKGLGRHAPLSCSLGTQRVVWSFNCF